jgi:hypothetical protein
MKLPDALLCIRNWGEVLLKQTIVTAKKTYFQSLRNSYLFFEFPFLNF